MDDFLKDSTPEERKALFDSLNEDLLQVFDEDTVNLDEKFKFPLIHEATHEEDGDDRIKFIEEIGRGGMKVIHKCVVEQSGKVLVIATLRNKSDQKSIERFLQEAKITAMLEHENIVKIYDSGISSSYGPYIAMKYSEGMSLSQILQEISLGNEDMIKKYPLNKRLEIFEKVSSAIDYAHNEGVVHLDIKPENVLVGERSGRVFVCDWGLARILPEFETDENYAFSSISEIYSKGSPGYMAPEQIVKNEKTIETDVYQLGALLYSILFYRSPVQGEDLEEVLERTVAGQLDLPKAKNDNDLTRLIRKALAINPSERFRSVASMMSAYRKVSATFLELERRQEKILKQKINRFRNDTLRYRKKINKTKIEILGLIVIVIVLVIFLVVVIQKDKNFGKAISDLLEDFNDVQSLEEEIDAENSYYKILKDE